MDGHELQRHQPRQAALARRRPAAGATKRDLLRYFARVSPFLLPHLADRPLFVTRFPNGITGKSFFQKHWEPAPPFARTVASTPPTTSATATISSARTWRRCSGSARWPGLELHAWFSRTDPAPDARGRSRRFTGSEAALERSILNYPDFVVFDLDPYLYSGKEAQGEEPELQRRAFNRTRTLALGSARCSTGSGSTRSSRRRAGPGSTSISRSCATSTSTPRAVWPRPSPARRSASGRRT